MVAPPLSLFFVVWLCALPLAPLTGSDFWAWTTHEAFGWAALAAILAPQWRKLAPSAGFWLAAAIVAWFWMRTPAAEWNKVRMVALAAGVCLAMRFLPREMVRRLPGFLLGAGAVILALSFAAGASPGMAGVMRHWYPRMAAWNKYVRWAGFFHHPNLFAFFIVFCLWAGMFSRWPMEGRPRQGRPTAALAALGAPVAFGALAGWRLFKTYSRLGWALFGAACALRFFAAWREGGGSAAGFWGGVRERMACWAMTAAVVAVLGGSLAYDWRDTAARFKTSGAELRTAEERSAGGNAVVSQAAPVAAMAPTAPPGGEMLRGDIYREAWSLWERRFWTGWGLGAYARMGHASHHHSHDLYLEAGLAGGAIGLILLMAPLLWAVWRGQGAFARGFVVLSLLSGILDCYFAYRWPAVALAACVGLALRSFHRQ